MSFPGYSSYKDSGLEWLGSVPSDWDVVSTKRVATFKYGDSLPAEVRDENGEIPVFGSNGPVGVHNQANTKAPAIFIGRKGSCGALNWSAVSGFGIDTVYFVDETSSDCNLRWLFWALQILRLDQASQDTGVPGLAREFAHETRLCLPSRFEQSAIASFLDQETAKIDALVEDQQRLIELLKEKRQAVISHAVTKGLDSNAPMKDSGIEWLGEVPAHWKLKPLMRLTAPGRNIMYGIVLPGPNMESGVPIVKGGDVRPHRLKLDLLARTTPEIEEPFARARLRPNDIVYSIRGSIGDAELVPDELLDANITQDVARVSPSDQVECAWLLYALKSKPIFAQLEQRSLGATIKGINIFDLKRARLAVPPPEEQLAIASYLNREMAWIDLLSSEAETGIALLQERRSALISAVVTGKIDVRGLVPVQAKAA